ncbi:MAG: hypothetical protein GVY13_16930 [Alphaproteobacteria bacterium]|jgi:hypothetical protein|nr:hypothetical protein [Alphaproteobacteria bacterium]
MPDAEQSIATTCRETASIAAKAIDWLKDNPDKVRQELPVLSREFRKFGTTARKLETAVHRPMCVGVFGPSQAGKSYLISALARRGTDPLMARFADMDEGIDFVREINPEGGQESTGLVTRFTIQGAPTPEGYPVALRLLSQTDIIKIIGNTFLSDLDLSEEEIPTPQKIRALIDELSPAAQGQPVDPLTEDDVYDLQEYFEKHFKGEAIVKALGGPFWSAAAELAPRLPIGPRAALFSVLWGHVEPFTALYTRLYGALSALGFAADAYCPIEALVPRDESIIDVRTLAGIDAAESTSSLAILSATGQKVSLPRAFITALIAELQIVIQDKPWPFFDHTDLLDFPGARSRENIPDIRRFLTQPNALQSLFLRGKVAYLFDRYCAEQELTSMLLCIGPSNQEVRTLPGMVKDWIDSTHGPEPADRAKHQTALFLVLTKFDAEFEEKAGQAETSEGRWTARLHASLLDFFGKADDWPIAWTPGEPFRNTFWLRNPNYKAKHILDYDEEGREQGVRKGEEGRIARFRADYLANPLVKAHFAEPQKAWDEAFRANDGGITYLAESLAPVCNPEIKRRQIASRVGNLRGLMLERLGRYYVTGNLEDELRKRRALAHRTVKRLAQCVQAQRFGRLLQTMQMTDAELADIYYQVETRPNGEDEGQSGSAPAIGIPVRADDILAEVFGDEFSEVMDEETTVVPKSAPRDSAALFADTVLEHWMDELHALADTPRVYNYLQMSESSMSNLVSEIIAGARRLNLRDSIADRVRQITSFRQKLEVAMAKPALIAATIVNAYVDYLGFEGIAPEERPQAGQGDQRRPIFASRLLSNNGPNLTEERVPFDRVQYVDWITAFLNLVESNAMNQDGREVDVAQNARLGDLVKALDRA